MNRREEQRRQRRRLREHDTDMEVDGGGLDAAPPKRHDSTPRHSHRMAPAPATLPINVQHAILQTLDGHRLFTSVHGTPWCAVATVDHPHIDDIRTFVGRMYHDQQGRAGIREGTSPIDGSEVLLVDTSLYVPPPPPRGTAEEYEPMIMIDATALLERELREEQEQEEEEEEETNLWRAEVVVSRDGLERE